MKSLELTKTLKATPDRVFRAWTSAEELHAWHCPAGYEVGLAECDPREGGSYRISMIAPDGSVHIVGGTYIELTKPSQLRMTWAWEVGGDPAHGSVLTIKLTENPSGGTDLLLRHDDLETEESLQNHIGGWTGALNNLADFVSQ